MNKSLIIEKRRIRLNIVKLKDKYEYFIIAGNVSYMQATFHTYGKKPGEIKASNIVMEPTKWAINQA